MDIIEKIECLNAKQKQLDEEKLSIKSEFESYIKNKSISVCQRWHVFVQADDVLKNHSCWLPGRNDTVLMEQIRNMMQIPECYGRGKRINTSDILEDGYSIEEKMFYPQYWEKCSLEPASDYLTHDIQDLKMFALMEEILECNLGSFCLDW